MMKSYRTSFYWMSAAWFIMTISWWNLYRDSNDDTKTIDRAAVLLIESDIDADTRRAGVEALAELLRVRRGDE